MSDVNSIHTLPNSPEQAGGKSIAHASGLAGAFGYFNRARFGIC